MDFKLKIDAAKIASQFKEMAKEVEQDLSRGVEKLAAMSYTMMMEKAQSELTGSPKSVFNQNTKFSPQSKVNVHVIEILGPAMWIEDGIAPGTDMKEWFFKNTQKTKVSKDGHRYRVISFKHNAPPSGRSDGDKQLAQQIQGQLNSISRKNVKNGGDPIKWSKIEMDPVTKSPRIGKLHEFNMHSDRSNPKWSADPLAKLMIFQSIEKDKAGNPVLDKGGKPKVKRDIVTLRTASENPTSKDGGTPPKDKFIYPGYPAKKFIDQTYEKAMVVWENEILPEILKKWK